MKQNEIWIYVSGGCVIQVKATDPLLKVNLIDYDNLEVSDEGRPEYEQMELLSENMSVVF